MHISNTVRALSVVLLLFTFLTAFSVPDEAEKAGNKKTMQISETDNTEFSLALYQTLGKSNSGNFFFSPYSVSTALSMTLAGAAGQTEKQMASLLRAPENIAAYHAARAALEKKIERIAEKGNVTLETANSLWPQKGYALSQAFLKDLKRYYGSTVTPVDYRDATEAARNTINTWVEKKTRDKIRELLKPGILNSLTRLTLVNAIYFKGDWSNRFDGSATTDAPFFIRPDSTESVSMMHQKRKFRYGASDSLQIIELPYSGEDLSMLILLPAEKNGISGLEETLTPKTLDDLSKSLRETTVSIFLPKFTVTSTLRLDETLRTLGMTDAFDPAKADFSRMTSQNDKLFIGAVVHKAFIDVNEEGTEAAAATGVVISLTSAMPRPEPVFRADHPFLFLIRENRSGSILFMGRVAEPGNSMTIE